MLIKVKPKSNHLIWFFSVVIRKYLTISNGAITA